MFVIFVAGKRPISGRFSFTLKKGVIPSLVLVGLSEDLF